MPIALATGQSPCFIAFAGIRLVPVIAVLVLFQFVHVCVGIWAVPFVLSWFNATSWVFVPELDQWISSAVNLAPFPQCSSRYQVGAF